MQVVPFTSGDEQDALTRWRHFLYWKPGERKRIKRVHNRKIRRHLQKVVRQEIRQA